MQVSELRKAAPVLRLRGIENNSQRKFNVPAPQPKCGAGFEFSRVLTAQNLRPESGRNSPGVELKTASQSGAGALIKKILIY